MIYIGIFTIIVIPIVFFLYKKFQKIKNRAIAESIFSLAWMSAYEHLYDRVKLEDFPNVEPSFYQKTSTDLERKGFSFLTDFMDVTASRQAGMDLILRCCHKDHCILAQFYFFQNPQLTAGVVDLETYFSDEHVICTTNAPLSLGPPQGKWDRLRIAGASLDDLLMHHQERMAAWMNSHPKSQPILVANAAEAIDLIAKGAHEKLLLGRYRSSREWAKYLASLELPFKGLDNLLKELDDVRTEKMNEDPMDGWSYPFALEPVNYSELGPRYEELLILGKRQQFSPVCLGTAFRIFEIERDITGYQEEELKRSYQEDVFDCFDEEFGDDLGEELEVWPESELKHWSNAWDYGSELYFSRFPVIENWKVFGYFSCIGDWKASVHLARHRLWSETYDSEVVYLNTDLVICNVKQPPKDKETARALTYEQLCYCRDLFALGTLDDIAAHLLNNHVWVFWWD